MFTLKSWLNNLLGNLCLNFQKVGTIINRKFTECEKILIDREKEKCVTLKLLEAFSWRVSKVTLGTLCIRTAGWLRLLICSSCLLMSVVVVEISLLIPINQFIIHVTPDMWRVTFEKSSNDNNNENNNNINYDNILSRMAECREIQVVLSYTVSGNW